MRSSFASAVSDHDASQVLPQDATTLLMTMAEEVMKAAEKTLQRHEQLAAIQIPDVISQVTATLNTISTQTSETRELRQRRDALIAQANTKQLHEVMDSLEAISAAEQARRENEAAAAATDNNNNTANVVSPVQLKRMFAAKEVLAESETVLSSWISELIQEQVDTAVADSKFAQLQTVVATTADRESTMPASSSLVVTTAEAATEIQAALHRHAQDGIGRIDYAGSIVHELTSPTYTTTDDAHTTTTLGHTWWSRYIPQDWEEYLFPPGWESWKAPAAIVPDHVYHSIGLPGAAVTAPPETVLQATVLPGQCWPVAMSHGGGSSSNKPQATTAAPPAVVTIRLTQPVAVSAVTIDHASRLLLSDPDQQLQTAPKIVKIYGYAPCGHTTTSSTTCDDGLGFDVASKALLAEITYDIHGESNVQTFATTGSLESTKPNVHHDDDGSCSAVEAAHSCGGGEGSAVIAAVSVEIVENWGNKDYTCLYRIRVHGDPAI